MNILMPDKKERDEEAILRSVARTLTRVVEGGKDGPAYPSPQSEQALNAVINRLDELSAQNNNNPTGNVPTTEQDDEPDLTGEIEDTDAQDA
jgi:hypothetical protein